MANTDQAYVTLATTDAYSLGALVLGRSLRRVRTNRTLVCMITSGVSQEFITALQSVFDCVPTVDVMDSRDVTNLDVLSRPDLGVTFTKLQCWRLTQFNKCVFLDADCLVIQNVDELFDRDELSGAPDAGWPDCFNSGVFVFRPSLDTYNALVQFAVSHGSFDGGDQGLLNLFFKDWATKDITKRLPFIYNVVSQAFYSYLPAFNYFNRDVKIVHFIGAVKPWHQAYNETTRQVQPHSDPGHSVQYLQLWWDIFTQDVRPRLTTQLATDPSTGVVVLPGYCEQDLSDGKRQYQWENGCIDYNGIDAFVNIEGQIKEKLSKK